VRDHDFLDGRLPHGCGFEVDEFLALEGGAFEGLPSGRWADVWEARDAVDDCCPAIELGGLFEIAAVEGFGGFVLQRGGGGDEGVGVGIGIGVVYVFLDESVRFLTYRKNSSLTEMSFWKIGSKSS
jgi:hypothetical protein